MQENPFKWSSIANLPVEFYLTRGNKGGRDKRLLGTALLDRRFDSYEKLDGTNIGYVAWPRAQNGVLLGRNYVIPASSTEYQDTPLDSLRDPAMMNFTYGLSRRLVFDDEGLSDDIKSGVKNVVLYGEFIMRKQADSNAFGYSERGINAGKYILFGAMVVCTDSSSAFSLLAYLRGVRGFACKSKLADQSAVQICMNGNLEDWIVNGNPSVWPSSVTLPACFSRNMSLLDSVREHVPRLTWHCHALEGIVLTESTNNGRNCKSSEIIFKWKTGLTDDSTCEKHLRQIKKGYDEGREKDDESTRFCVEAFLTVYEQNPAVKRHREGDGRLARHTVAGGGDKSNKTVDVDKRRIGLLVDIALTKMDVQTLIDRSLDKQGRVRLAESVVNDVVTDYFSLGVEKEDEGEKRAVTSEANTALWKEAMRRALQGQKRECVSELV